MTSSAARQATTYAPRPAPVAVARRAPRGLLMTVFTAGSVIAVVMLARAQVAGDALGLLVRGWLFAVPGIWVPFGNPVASTTGGYLPGGLTALVVGLPLKLWMDHRSPVVLILLTHIAAYALMDRLVAETLGRRARIILAVLYWLNPWQLYQCSWLDNSNYVFLTGAIHAWTCYRQRLRPSWIHSALLVASVGLTAQLHLCATLLVIAAALLWWRGYWKPHWGGVALGTAVTFGALVPYFFAVAAHPDLLPLRDGRPLGTGLLRVAPVVRGLFYWIRYPSLAASSGMNLYDFTPALGAGVDRWLAPLATVLGRGVAMVTVAPVIAANIWALRRLRRRSRSVAPADRTARDWLLGYALWTFVAGLIANALSPTTTMWWHNLILFHAAILPPLLWTTALLRTRRAPVVRRAAAAWTGLCLALLVAMTFGAELYRHGGREAWSWVVASNDRVIQDLHLTRYGITIDPIHGVVPQNQELLYREYMGRFELPPPGGGLAGQGRGLE